MAALKHQGTNRIHPLLQVLFHQFQQYWKNPCLKELDEMLSHRVERRYRFPVFDMIFLCQNFWFNQSCQVWKYVYLFETTYLRSEIVFPNFEWSWLRSNLQSMLWTPNFLYLFVFYHCVWKSQKMPHLIFFQCQKWPKCFIWTLTDKIANVNVWPPWPLRPLEVILL